MDLLRFASRRARAYALVNVALVCGLSFTAGVVTAGPIYIAGAERAIVFDYLSRASPLATNVIVTKRTSANFDQAEATAAIRSAMAPLRISHVAFQEESGTARVSFDRTTVLAPLAHRDGLFAEVSIIQGRAPTAPDEVLLSQRVATALDVRPGAVVHLGYASMVGATVAGIYAPTSGSDALVFGQGRLLSVSRPSTEGPLPMLTTSAGFTSLTRAFGQTSGIAVEWDARPRFDGLTPGALDALAKRETHVAASIRARLTGASVSSDLGSLVSGAERVVGQGLGPTYVVVIAVALVGLGVLLGIATMKLDRQSFELAILKSRGARTRELVALQAAEAALVCVTALPFSLLVALALALVARAAHGPALSGAAFPIALTRDDVLVGVVASGAAAVSLLLVSIPGLRQTVIAERRGLSRQGRPGWLRYPLELIPLLAGGIAFAELHRHGVRAPAGNLDLFVLAGPTLLLVGVGMLAVRVMFHVAVRIDRSADGSSSPSSYLALHRLSRSNANAALALLIVLSTALFVFASSLRITELTRNEEAARRQVGADWSVLVAPPMNGIRAAEDLGPRQTLVFYGSTTSTDTPRFALASVIAVDPSTYQSGGWWQPADANLPLSSLLSRLGDVGPVGSPVPSGATSLRLTVWAPDVHGLRLWVVLEQPDGGIAERELGTLDGTATYTAPLAGADRILSIVVRAASGAAASLRHAGPVLVRFERLELLGASGARTEEISRWQGLFTGQDVVRTSTIGGALLASVVVVRGGPVGGIAPPAAPLPALVGGVGNRPPPRATLQVGSELIPIDVVGGLRAFPTATEPGLPFVVIPLRPLLELAAQTLQASSGGAFAVLAMGESSPVAGARAAGLQAIHVSAARTIEAALASRQENLAIGLQFAAGVAGIALAVLAFALGVLLAARRHEYEFASLEALGGRPGDAISSLALEYAVVLGCSLLVGGMIGLGVLALVLPFVSPPARVGIPSGMLLDWPVLGAGMFAAVATFVAAIAVAAARIRRPNTVALLRGEPA